MHIVVNAKIVVLAVWQAAGISIKSIWWNFKRRNFQTFTEWTKIIHVFWTVCFSEYAVVDAENTVKVPYNDIDLGIVAPLGCGIQTGAGTVLNKLKPDFGSSIVVFGCGTVGMSAIMAARIARM